MSDIVLPVGFRFGAVYQLDTDGMPKATSTTAYAGVEFAGPKAFNITVPQARLIEHQGKDRIIMTDQLPALTAIAGEIRVSSLDYDLEALLTGVTNFAEGDAKGISRSTDKQGSEPEVGLLLYHQAKDRVTGLRTWHYFIIPSTRCLPIPANWAEIPEDHRYTINPSQTTKHLWGAALQVGTEGVTEHGFVDMHAPYKPAIEAFLADGTLDTFVLLHTAINNTYSVWDNGVLVISSITKTTVHFVFGTAPTAGHKIVVRYGLAA